MIDPSVILDPAGSFLVGHVAGKVADKLGSTSRDKASLDIFWLRDESLEDSANLPDPHILAQEITDDLRTSLEQIEDVLADLQTRVDA